MGNVYIVPKLNLIVKCEEENDEFKCLKCSTNYYLAEENYCYYCGERNQFISEDNNCIQCNDFQNGGIEGCGYCEINVKKAICKVCQDGYILLSNNKTCLKISQNKELKQFYYCDEITLNSNNQLHCSRWT